MLDGRELDFRDHPLHTSLSAAYVQEAEATRSARAASKEVAKADRMVSFSVHNACHLFQHAAQAGLIEVKCLCNENIRSGGNVSNV